MFKPSHLSLTFKPAALIICIAPAIITPAIAADLTHLRPGGRVNSLSALRGASPNALNRALSHQVAPAPTHRGPTVPIAPSNRGQGAVTHRQPTHRTPSIGRRPSLSGMINRLNSASRLVAPRPSGTRRPSGSHHRLVTPTRVEPSRRPDNTRHMVTGGSTAAAIRALAAQRNETSLGNDKVEGRQTLQEKIAAQIAARAEMENEAASKDGQKGVSIDPGLAEAVKDPAQSVTEMVIGADDDDTQVHVVTGAQQTLNPDLRTSGQEGPSIVTVAAEHNEGPLRTEDGDVSTQKSDDDDKRAGEPPYDEFRVNAAQTPGAPHGPAASRVPGLVLANVNGFKEFGMEIVTHVPGQGRPGGASGFDVLPEWQTPGLVDPGGTPLDQPGSMRGSWFDALRYGLGAAPGTSSATQKGPEGITIVGTGRSSVLGNRTERPNDNVSDNRVMDEDGDFTQAELAASDSSTEPHGTNVFYDDGSSNEYFHHPSGSVTIASYDKNDVLTSITYHHPGEEPVSINLRGSDSPCADETGGGDCGSVASDDGGSSVTIGEATGQPDSSHSEGGIVFINGQPVGRLLTQRNGDCKAAKCNDASDWFGGSVNFSEAPNPFGLFERVVNPSPRS